MKRFRQIIFNRNIALVLFAIPGASAPAAERKIWDYRSGSRDGIVWRARIKHGAGPMTVTDSRILLGTSGPDSKAGAADIGLLECLDRGTGTLIWKVEHQKLLNRIHDMPSTPIGSRPFVDHDRVYYMSNRGELCCVALSDGHPLWHLDMVKDLKIFKRDPMDVGILMPSPVVVGGLVYCVTGNGATPTAPGVWSVLQPDAPSFLAVNKDTHKVIWSANSPGRNIAYGQWSTPAFATVDGIEEVLFPGGDGYLYSFERLSGKPLWKVRCGDPHETWPDFSVCPPLVNGNIVYVSVSRDIEFTGPKSRPLCAIDLRNHEVLWKRTYHGFNGTIGPMAIAGGKLFASALSGVVVAVDVKTGAEFWRVDLEDSVYGGVCADDGQIYVASNCALHVMSAATGRPLQHYDFDSCSLRTPLIADSRLYITTTDFVWCLNKPSWGSGKGQYDNR